MVRTKDHSCDLGKEFRELKDRNRRVVVQDPEFALRVPYGRDLDVDPSSADSGRRCAAHVQFLDCNSVEALHSHTHEQLLIHYTCQSVSASQASYLFEHEVPSASEHAEDARAVARTDVRSADPLDIGDELVVVQLQVAPVAQQLQRLELHAHRRCGQSAGGVAVVLLVGNENGAAQGSNHVGVGRDVDFEPSSAEQHVAKAASVGVGSERRKCRKVQTPDDCEALGVFHWRWWSIRSCG